ncbi:MAG: hypothetical protein HF308_18585 [Ignavibacteria bacterium]|jgi:hypothetical protein|nr:hypothetical protein [Ignavibacteria bacterium]
MNNIITLIITFIVAVGGAVGLSGSDQFTKDIQSNVKAVDTVVSGVANSQDQYRAGSIGVGQYRADCQEAQRFITRKYQESSNDVTLTEKQRALNDEYRAYLMECSKVVTAYQNGDAQDTSRMTELRNKLL